MKYFVEMLKAHGGDQPAAYTLSLADMVIKNIEQHELVRQQALKLGLSVSEEEITEELKKAELPDNEAYRDLVESQLLADKLLEEYFDQQVPVAAEQRHVMAMLLESEAQAKEIRARLEGGESFAELAEELSLDPLSKSKQGDLGWHPREILSEWLSAPIVDYIFSAEVGVLSPPIYDEEVTKSLGYWVVRVVERNEEEEARIQLMLLGSEALAEEIISRLEAGEDFGTLAKEFSQLKGVEENEGEYEIGPGMTSPLVDAFVFDPETEPQTLSQPLRDSDVTTEGGYWLIKVVAEDKERKLDKDDRDLLKAKAFNEWLSSLWDDPQNQVDDSYLDLEKKSWALQQARRG
jgi:parvulin-like peptidyl-prolyl isomerase